MPTPPLHSSVPELERAFLRKAWWLFPALGALAALAVGGPFWAWVDGQPLAIRWAQLFSLRAGAAALAGLAVWAVWFWGLRLRRAKPWALLLAAGMLVGAEMLLRSPLAQTPLWLAARARLDAGQHFMREVCYVRLEEAAGRADDPPAAILVGSSQMLHGVNVGKLAALQPRPVIRRAMFGMAPLKALAMRAYVPFRPGDVCAMYLSEFDFTNQEPFPFDWFRPYASWRTLPDVMRCVPKSTAIREWRHIVDFALAATTEWWRARDFIRPLVFRFWLGGARADVEAAPADLAAAAAKARGALRFSDADWNAFRRYADLATAQDVKLLVFEGDVNPAIYSAERTQAKEATREKVSAFVAAGHGRYVSLAEQALELEPEDWLDMTHLTPAGSEKLTRRLAQELAQP